MNPKILFLCVIIGLIHKSYSACLCGFGQGTDACADGFSSTSGGGPSGGGPSGGGPSGGAHCAPMVVRPAPIPQIRFITGTTGPALKPIGDLCSCRQTIVVPANVPRPACRKCGGSATIYEPVPSVHPSEPHEYPYPTGRTGSVGIPVDPVSLGIVYAQSHKSCGRFADDRIFYGPGVLPRDEPILKPIKSKLPERSLYQIKGVPIELLPIPSCQRKVYRSLEEEALEDLQLEADCREEEDQETRNIPQFTYDDLGFSVVTPDQPKFIAVQGTAPDYETSDEVIIDDIGDFTGGTFKCKDGYRPGNVIVKSIPHRDVYIPAPHIPITCAGEESDDTLYPIITNPYPGNPWPGSDVIYEPYPCDS